MFQKYHRPISVVVQPSLVWPMEGMKAFQGVPCEGIPLQLYPPTCRLSSGKEQPTLSDTPVKRTDRDLDQIHSWTTLGENGHDDCHLEDRLQTGFIS